VGSVRGSRCCLGEKKKIKNSGFRKRGERRKLSALSGINSLLGDEGGKGKKGKATNRVKKETLQHKEEEKKNRPSREHPLKKGKRGA